ncbi:hypothetical protein FIBSPDRAFT_969743 [Athelia psychrophila]|uniref:Uncharacterized protein n=1 Tax=Athelia psychrophila TaxID=1759441 RepID=A0A167T7X7_9AGAM|nr:hypothetical protein FIBSPDRAFT_969743 [Fibularhizoctonia sp. CBS 109695]
MFTNAQEEHPFDHTQATYKAAQTTVWLHTSISDASQQTERGHSNCSRQRYIYVLFWASGGSLVVPDWLKPLRKTSDGWRECSGSFNLDSVPIAPAGEPAYLQLTPGLLQLMTAYPIDILGLPPEPVPEPQDVSMAEPEKLGNKKEETGTLRDRGSHDANIPETSSSRYGTSTARTRVGVAHKKLRPRHHRTQ